jgi:thiosulfate/3-mercaptopyruvate sulfurtransferase
MASLDEVADGPACLLNALSPAVFRGEENRYGRAGRIPGSVNVYAHSIVDPETHRLLPRDALRERFDAVGALTGERVVAYCGAGISATLDAFALTLLGADDVAVYDGSMAEWIADAARPLERG